RQLNKQYTDLGHSRPPKRDDLAASHSITSAAVDSSVSGTSRPSALAVFRFDHEFVLGRRLHRKVGRLRAFEDAVDVAGCLAKLVDEIGPIRHQPARRA